MAAFLGISLWIALATVVPGLVTVAAIDGAVALISPLSIGSYIADLKGFNEWVYAGAAMTIMVLTQSVGILLEGILVHRHLLGPLKRGVEVPEGIDPCGLTKYSLEPYSEYDGLYLLLAELRENEDSQGHLQRAIAQFFLTNNTIVSFTAGMVAAILMMGWGEKANFTAGMIYLGVLAVCIIISYTVARIRFTVMAKALWAARRRRLEPAKGESEKVFSSVIGESLSNTSNTNVMKGNSISAFRKGGSMISFFSKRSMVARRLFAVVTGALLIFGSATRSSAATTFYTCKSVDVHSFAERIHVRCDKPAGGGIVFFAVATANSAHAARILSVLMTAHLTARNIVIEYDPNDTSGTAFGCQAHDCRRLLSVGVL